MARLGDLIGTVIPLAALAAPEGNASLSRWSAFFFLPLIIIVFEFGFQPRSFDSISNTLLPTYI